MRKFSEKNSEIWCLMLPPPSPVPSFSPTHHLSLAFKALFGAVYCLNAVYSCLPIPVLVTLLRPIIDFLSMNRYGLGSRYSYPSLVSLYIQNPDWNIFLYIDHSPILRVSINVVLLIFLLNRTFYNLQWISLCGNSQYNKLFFRLRTQTAETFFHFLCEPDTTFIWCEEPDKYPDK